MSANISPGIPENADCRKSSLAAFFVKYAIQGNFDKLYISSFDADIFEFLRAGRHEFDEMGV